MRRTISLLATVVLTLLAASGVALAAAIGPADAQSSVVGPGESIQKAVNAANPGDTIVVRGIHREDVVIRKDGIELRGIDGAVIEAPPRAEADSPCSKAYGPEGICVLGDVDLETDELEGKRVSDVSVSGLTVRGFERTRRGAYAIDAIAAQNATIVGNRLTGNGAGGIFAAESVSTTVTKNRVIGNPERDGPGINVEASSRSTVVGNNISGSAWGIAVIDARRGFFAGNTIRNTCGGMFFEAAPSQPVDDFEVKGNTVEDNKRSCRAAEFGANFSGIGIAVLGARGMEVTGNRISGNVPSGPTPVSGGIVVSRNPYFGGSVKPRDNSVTGNRFGRNEPDIFWDESGSGNRFVGNLCNSSVPGRLCN